MSKEVEKLNALLELFPNSQNLIIGFDSEKEDAFSIDLDSTHFGGYEKNETEDKGNVLSVVYKGKNIHFVDHDRFLKAIQK